MSQLLNGENSDTDFQRGRLVVLVGPSAVGKSSVIRRLKELLPQMYFSVSVTTRAPREGEIDGRDYTFLTKAEFSRLITEGGLLEWAEIHGGLQRSGTLRVPVENALTAGKPTLIEVDLAGAASIKEQLPEAITVFLKPPSWEILVSRLTGRGTETSETIERRLATARIELAQADSYDYSIINDVVDEVAQQLISLLVGSRSSSAMIEKTQGEL